MRLHNISYTLDRKSVRSDKPKILDTVIEETNHLESKDHYLELVKLIDCMLIDND